MCTPVEAVAPVTDQVAQVVDVGAIVPACTFDLVGETCGYQASLQVLQHVVGYIELEAFDCFTHRRFLTRL